MRKDYGGRYQISSSKDNDFFGVGVTIHLTQLFDYLLRERIISNNCSTVSSVMVSGIGSIEHAMYLSAQLRDDGIKTEIFLDQEMEIGKQIAYAKKRGFKLFVWTNRTAEKLRADDIVFVQDLRHPSRPEKRACANVFTGIQVLLGEEGLRRNKRFFQNVAPLGCLSV